MATVKSTTDPIVMVIESSSKMMVQRLQDMYELVIETDGQSIVFLFDETGPAATRIWNFANLIEGTVNGS